MKKFDIAASAKVILKSHGLRVVVTQMKRGQALHRFEMPDPFDDCRETARRIGVVLLGRPRSAVPLLGRGVFQVTDRRAHLSRRAAELRRRVAPRLAEPKRQRRKKH